MEDQKIGEYLQQALPKSAAIISSPLSAFSGDWNIARESKGLFAANLSEESLAMRLVLGGRFLQQEYSAVIDGEPYTGIGSLGFDENTQEFIEEWKDSAGSVHRISTADYDVSSSLIRMRYKLTYQGKTADYVSEWRLQSNLTWEYLLTENGKEIKRVLFKRK